MSRYREDPDEHRCTCPPFVSGVNYAPMRAADECPVHGQPEPPEPDHDQLKLELDPRWAGRFPDGF